jgi:hypothetical protein
LELRAVTRQMIRTTEEESGFPVRVTDDPNLPTFASLSMARGQVAAHIITYRPQPGEPPDHAICYQCGIILRKFAVPPEQRVDYAVRDAAYAEVHRMLTGPGGLARKVPMGEEYSAKVSVTFS